MTESTAGVLVVLVLQLLWFLAQAVIFFLLWNFAFASYFELANILLVEALAIYALLRLIVDPPKLTFEID